MTTYYAQLNLTDPDYMDLWSFEKDFDAPYWSNWFLKYGYSSIPLSLLYVGLVFWGKSWMRDRQPYKLQTPLVLWNLALAVMSILIVVRISPEFFLALRDYGLHSSICEWKWESNRATAFWAVVMLFSKLFELGDTAFVVLRKQKLIFLHWYHHTMTLTGWWLVAGLHEPAFLWFGWMNAIVHSVMYSYYALKALKFKLSRNVSMFVTSIQLVQMVMAVALSTYSVWTMLTYGDESCPHRNWYSLKMSFSIYSTYAVLFAKLFIDYYVLPSKRKKGPVIVSTKKVE